jgi:hypothetical protein
MEQGTQQNHGYGKRVNKASVATTTTTTTAISIAFASGQ